MQGNSTGKTTSARISPCPTDLNSIEGTESLRPTQPGTCHPAKTLLPVYPKVILISLVTVNKTMLKIAGRIILFTHQQVNTPFCVEYIMKHDLPRC